MIRTLFLFFLMVTLGGRYLAANAQSFEQRLMSIEDTYNPSLKWGIVGGATGFGKITNIETTIINENYFINGFSKFQQPQLGLLFGFFTHYKIPRVPLGWYNEIAFAQQGTDFHYYNKYDFNYDMRFNYQYINIVEMLRVYPFMPRQTSEGVRLQGLYLGGGGQLGFNIAPENISYYSYGGGKKIPDFGDDLDQQTQLRQVLKGKTDFGLTAELGYIIPRYRIDIGFRGHYSLTDLVETQPNSYQFIENPNHGLFFQAVVRLDLSGLGNNIR